jgi:hypothetical protein
MTLSEACNLARKDIDNFEKEYIKENKKFPDNYPLELQDDNSGLFFEMIVDCIMHDVVDGELDEGYLKWKG